jgi:hypothetical protein
MISGMCFPPMFLINMMMSGQSLSTVRLFGP